MTKPRILAYGDPHGDWRPLLDAARREKPDAAIILGDCELDEPLDRKLAPLLDAGIAVHWIAGNHDTDREDWHDNLFLSGLSDGNLHSRVVDIGGVRVAGLGGVFRGKVWRPGQGEPTHRTRRDYVRALAKPHRWREGWYPGQPYDGLPLTQRSSIFPEDVDRLAALRADVLVCHEAPTTCEYGWSEIDRLAAAMRVEWVVHGHHHRDYGELLANGVKVRGLRIAQPWIIRFRGSDT